MRRFTVVSLFALALVFTLALRDSAPALDDAAADLEGIEAVALDYIDGYYTGDGERMKSARRSIRRQDVFWWVNSFLQAAIDKRLDSFPVLEDYVPRAGDPAAFSLVVEKVD